MVTANYTNKCRGKIKVFINEILEKNKLSIILIKGLNILSKVFEYLSKIERKKETD